MMMRGPRVMKKFEISVPVVLCAVVGDANTSHTAGSAITHDSAYQRRSARRSFGRDDEVVGDEQDPDRQHDRGVVRLPEADEHRRPRPMTAAPRGHAEEQQHRTPEERLLAEQQPFEDRGLASTAAAHQP